MSTADVGALELRMPQEVAKATTIAFTRVFLGVMWLFELTVGHNWKIGGFGSDVHPGWIGAQRGDVVREDVAEAIADGTYSWFAWIYDGFVVPNAVAFSWLTIGIQAGLAIAFIVGVLVRPAALVALAMDLSIFMLGNSRIPPFFSAAHLFVLATGAGMYYGLDGWLVRTKLTEARNGAAKVVRWMIELPVLNARWRTPAMAAAALAGLFFFLQVRETPRIQMVSMELAAIFGLVALGLYASKFIPDRLAIIAAILRIFIGFKFLHEIWVRTEPGVNGLPGWASADAVGELFETVSENHWALFSWIADTVFLPAMPIWVLVFGVVQFAVGVALVLGWRTREASLVGLAYLGGLIIMGLTRYPPFVFGLLVAVIALDGGRVLSLDAKRFAEGLTPKFGLPVPPRAIPVLAVLSAVNFVAAFLTAFQAGIEPGAYVDSMGAMTTAMVAVLSGLFALGGWVQLRANRHGQPDPTADAVVRT